MRVEEIGEGGRNKCIQPGLRRSGKEKFCNNYSKSTRAYFYVVKIWTILCWFYEHFSSTESAS